MLEVAGMSPEMLRLFKDDVKITAPGYWFQSWDGIVPGTRIIPVSTAVIVEGKKELEDIEHPSDVYDDVKEDDVKEEAEE